MRWQDQSEAPSFPAATALLATLAPVDEQRLLAVDNETSRVLVTSSCMSSMLEHLEASSDERGGLLLGRVYRHGEGADAHVIVAERIVASQVFDSTGVSLRMEADLWNQARPFLDAGALVVGWYHSHPNLGAFFSETDRTTQRSFFRNSFNVGIVVDPVKNEMSAFVGPDSASVPAENLIVMGRP